MTVAITFGALIIGPFLVFAGMNVSDVKTILKGVIIVVCGFFVGVFGTPFIHGSRGMRILLTFACCVIVAVVIITVIQLIIRIAGLIKNEKRVRESIGGTNLDRFFVECVLSGADDFSQEKNRQQARHLADEYRLKYPNGIEALYQKGLEWHKLASQRTVYYRLKVRRTEEKKMFEELNKYSDLVGKEKRIAMLSDLVMVLSRAAKNQRELANMLKNSGQQKEQDWAIWGGIANGLGGFGAGIETAADIQRQNMKIREENERKRQAALPAYMFMTKSADGNSRNAEAIMQEISKFKTKPVSDEPKEKLLEKITFSNTDVLVSETGSAMVCTCASLDPDFVIFGNVPAVVDGTIAAGIYDGEKLCGTALLVLPVYGVGQDIPLKGICLDCCSPGKEYSVKFTAKNLWALEK